jgi:hypothetical protein
MKNEQNDKKHKSTRAREEVRETGHQPDLAPDDGNITERGTQHNVGGTRGGIPTSSGLTTKKTITGSDYDGQAE